MKDYRCKYCGGYINPATLKCDYCDTQYKAEADDLIPIIKVRETKTIPIVATVVVSKEVECMLPSYEIQKLVTRELSNKLAERIMDYARIDKQDNIRNLTAEYRAMVRIEDGNKHLEMEYGNGKSMRNDFDVSKNPRWNN